MAASAISGASPVQVPLVDLAAEYRGIKEEVSDAMTRVLTSTDLILGHELGLFESEFASFCGTANALGVDSGLAALELILRAFGIGPNDEVIVPANTFVASALAVSTVGATPVLVDIDPVTYTMDPAALSLAITPRTKAILPVHLYGHPADMDPICKIARRHGIHVIEDACQAHGACYRGRRAGNIGDAAAFSFYPAKNLGAYGDGGMVVTSDPAVARYVEMARNYGQREKYHHELLGHNHRLDTLQAAVLRVKLKRLDERNAARREHAQAYLQLLQDVGAVLPTAAPWVEHVWHLFVIRVERRDALRRFLAECGISCGVHYPVPVHLQEAYRSLGYRRGDLPITERFAGEILSLPMYPELTTSMIEYVADAVRRFLTS